MILGFHTKQLTERGTETALFDYALGAKNLLGHDVRIYVPSATEKVVPFVMKRFQEHFDVAFYDTPQQVACDALYVIKKGRPGRVTERLHELNHAFDDVSRPHGHRFAAVSDWLARTASHKIRLPRGRVVDLPTLRPIDVVPLIVTLPDVSDDLREELGIPDEGVVFGRHGGAGNFDATFAKAPMRVALDEREDIWFVFMNTKKFFEHERVIHVPLQSSRADVRRFVNTCDYMIHAHVVGEMFGLAVAEFAYVGAPVLTFLGSPKLGHLDLLSNGLLLGYRDPEELLQYLRTLKRRTLPVDSDVAARYSIQRVMSKFDDVFLR